MNKTTIHVEELKSSQHEKEYKEIKKKILSSKEFSVYDIVISFSKKSDENEFYRIYRKVERVIRDLINEKKIEFLKFEKSKSPSKLKRIYRVL